VTPDGLLIVVPARGGSKGLPGKNLISIGGRPLLSWTRHAISAAGLRDATALVSTDDDTIATVARQVGFDVPFMRSIALATDEASPVEVALDALDWVERERGLHPSELLWLQPTSPFRPPAAITRALQTYQDHDVNAVVGVTEIHRSLATLFYADDEMVLRSLGDAENRETRRQAVRTIYTPNGALYLVSTESFRAFRTFLPSRTAGMPMSQIESMDLDDPIDRSMMEAVASAGLAWMQ
jgi:N-acylneuraminate cytidylyltransferase/CMP-N,N'-diacetyllegionaminic acid synthase